MQRMNETNQSDYRYFLRFSARQFQRSLESLIREVDVCRVCPLATERTDEKCLHARGDIEGDT